MSLKQCRNCTHWGNLQHGLMIPDPMEEMKPCEELIRHIAIAFNEEAEVDYIFTKPDFTCGECKPRIKEVTYDQYIDLKQEIRRITTGLYRKSKNVDTKAEERICLGTMKEFNELRSQIGGMLDAEV